MIFTTASGSRYELNEPARRIRRLSGTAGPTPYQGPDGGWRLYQGISPVRVGFAVLIEWVRDDLPAGSDTRGHYRPGTLTTPVTAISPGPAATARVTVTDREEVNL